MAIGGSWVTPTEEFVGDWSPNFYGQNQVARRSMYANSANSYSLGDYDHPFGAGLGGGTTLGSSLSGVEWYGSRSDGLGDMPEAAAWNNGYLNGYDVFVGQDRLADWASWPGRTPYDADGNPLDGPAFTWQRDPASLTHDVEYESAYSSPFDSHGPVDKVALISWDLRITDYAERRRGPARVEVYQLPFGKQDLRLAEDDPANAEYDDVTWDIYQVTFGPIDWISDPSTMADYQDNAAVTAGAPPLAYDPAHSPGGHVDGYVSLSVLTQKLLAAVASGTQVASFLLRGTAGDQWNVPHPPPGDDGYGHIQLVGLHSTALRDVSEHPAFPDWTLTSACNDTPAAVGRMGMVDGLAVLLLRPHYRPARWRHLYGAPTLHVTPDPAVANIPATLTITPDWDGVEVIDGVTWTVNWGDGAFDVGAATTVEHAYTSAGLKVIEVTGTKAGQSVTTFPLGVTVVDHPDLAAEPGAVSASFE